MPKRVLIITYYWPPAGGAGVQRWLKFVKYLPGFGWDPVVYTAENGEFPVLDHSLEKDIPPGTTIIRKKIFEPYLFYKKFIGQKPEEKISAGFLSQSDKPPQKEKIARWIRGNLFIPDARKFWIRPSIRFLTKYLQENPVDVMVSTGPPHSMHLIGLGLKKKLNIPWITDFRDPWTNIDFYDELQLTKRADKKHRRLEEKVLRSADAVVAVTRSMQEEFAGKGAKNTFFIPNGYDPDDFTEQAPVNPKKFRIVYIGSINPARNPEVLWHVLKELTKDPAFAEELEILLIGKTDISVRKSLKEKDLEKYTVLQDYLPHEDIFRVEREAAVLLLLINRTSNAKGIITGKIFEYLTSGRPVLSIGPPDGEAARILEETNTGTTVAPDDQEALKKTILNLFAAYKKGLLMTEPRNLEKFSRKTLTQKMTAVFSGCLKK